VIRERLLELAMYAQRLLEQSGAPQELASMGTNARQLADTLARPLTTMAPNTH